jgi:hypothetical protein
MEHYITDPDKIIIHLKYLVNYSFGRSLHGLNIAVNVDSSLRALQKNSIHNFAKINLRAAYLNPDKCKLGSSDHLFPYQTSDIFGTLENVQQFRKFGRLAIVRKHSPINHVQRIIATVDKTSSLGNAILKFHNCAAARLISPKTLTMIKGASQKSLNPFIYPSSFFASIQRNTYSRKKSVGISTRQGKIMPYTKPWRKKRNVQAMSRPADARSSII